MTEHHVGGGRWVHRLRLGYSILAAVVLAFVVATLAVGGRPDPAGPARTLYGVWAFHAGDDVRWADPRYDDAGWERTNLTSTPETRDDDVGLPGLLDGWGARGHRDLEGFGWYRLHVTVAPAGTLALLGPTMVDDGYQMFWNGKLVGGVGDFAKRPKVIKARPFLVDLPPSSGDGLLAIRAFMQPGFGRGPESGGLRSAPTIAPLPTARLLNGAQWRRTVAGYIVEAALPLIMCLLAMGAVVLAPRLTRPDFANWLAIALVATSCLRVGNAIAAWTDILQVAPLVWLNTLLLSPLVMLAWTLTWNGWTAGREQRAVFLGAIGVGALRVAAAVSHADALAVTCRWAALALFAVIAARIARRGEHRALTLTAMLCVVTALFSDEIKRLGIPDIWFPFHIGVTLTQLAYAAALPLCCFVLTALDVEPASAADRLRVRSV